MFFYNVIKRQFKKIKNYIDDLYSVKSQTKNYDAMLNKDILETASNISSVKYGLVVTDESCKKSLTKPETHTSRNVSIIQSSKEPLVSSTESKQFIASILTNSDPRAQEETDKKILHEEIGIENRDLCTLQSEQSERRLFKYELLFFTEIEQMSNNIDIFNNSEERHIYWRNIIVSQYILCCNI